jgi:hypothetical protein
MQIIMMFLVFLISAASFADELTPRFGITIKTSDLRACATFDGRELNPGQSILFAVFDPPGWLQGKIAEKRSARCDTWDDLGGVAYEVQLFQKKELLSRLGVAYVGKAEKLAIKNDRPVLFTSSKAQPIIFHRCASNEGLHFSTWSGLHRIWHEYYPLGYDTDPTCTDAEGRE